VIIPAHAGIHLLILFLLAAQVSILWKAGVAKRLLHFPIQNPQSKIQNGEAADYTD
jgi:hypothetical protein